MCFVLLILIITTWNIVIALYTVAAITGILSSVLAFIYLMGWELGPVESIAIVIFIGLSVDYVVHMGHYYTDSIFDSKQKRMDFSFSQIGLTIVSSSITTYSSGVFLMFCNLLMLYKFGILI